MGRFWGPDTCYFLHPPLSAVDSHYFRGKTPEVKKTFIFGECEVVNQSRQDDWSREDGGGSGTGDVVQCSGLCSFSPAEIVALETWRFC